MFALAIFLGIYSYIIFCLGILSILYSQTVLLATVIFVFCLLYYFRKDLSRNLSWIKDKRIKIDKLSKIFLFLIVVQAMVNLIGVLGPEIGFDALWYHLSLPKIFLSEHSVSHISGGLFYYSEIPKLGEMFYIRALALGNENTAKLIHFMFGLLSLVALYKVSRKFFDTKLSLLACLLFYSNLVVGWESTTAYIDLFRTFFEIMAFWAFLEWVNSKEKKWMYESAIMTGLAISTKLISLGSLLVFTLLIFYVLRRTSFREIVKTILTFCLIALFVVSPWFIFSYFNTGNPVYPLFTKFYETSFNLSVLNPLNFLGSVFNLFLKSADPISPIYLILFPVLLVLYKSSKLKAKLLFMYSFVAIVIWYITPQTGGGRFILPYLPVLSVLGAYVIAQKKEFTKFFVALVIIVSLSSIGYRFLANSKFIPVILGKEPKVEFLTKNLNFSYGGFYDTDSYFKNNIKQNDRVLLYGFHNLYYADFPFIDASYVKKGDKFNYIAIQNGKISDRFSFWNLIHTNKTTNVKVYSLGGKMWHY